MLSPEALRRRVTALEQALAALLAACDAHCDECVPPEEAYVCEAHARRFRRAAKRARALVAS